MLSSKKTHSRQLPFLLFTSSYFEALSSIELLSRTAYLWNPCQLNGQLHLVPLLNHLSCGQQLPFVFVALYGQIAYLRRPSLNLLC